MQVLKQGEYVGDILSKAELPGLFASISAYDRHRFNDGWHCHENAHISFVLKGGCAEKKPDRYERLPGKYTFYLPGEPHQIVAMQHSVHVNLELDQLFFDRFDLLPDVFARTIQKAPDARLLMLQIYRELVSNDQLSIVAIEMLMLAFLERPFILRNEQLLPKWMKTIQEIIHDQCNEQLTLKELAASAGIHPVTISFYFPYYFGCTFGVYMRKLRIEKALELIRVPGKSLTDVALACGFFDQSHFIRVFRQMTGFLPSKYQRL